MTQTLTQSPLIVIGAGRSGSTLISRMLNAHGSIDFKGETSFLLARVWSEVWEDRFWLNWPRHVASGPHCASDPLPPWSQEDLATERMRTGRLVAELFVKLLRVEQAPERRWGYKELWSGLPQYRHGWRAHDAVLPGAQWLHLVRHPFDFARSSAHWNGTGLTRAYLEARLSNWVSMLEYNRQRQQSGRYHELRFEDLVHDPRQALDPVLTSMGLAWEPAVGKVAETRTMSSRHARDGAEPVLTGADARALIDLIPGLSAAMASCRYAPPERTSLVVEAPAESSVDLRDPDGERRGGFVPRATLEEQLHAVRSALVDLSAIVSDCQQQAQGRSNPELEARIHDIWSGLERLKDAAKQ